MGVSALLQLIRKAFSLERSLVLLRLPRLSVLPRLLFDSARNIAEKHTILDNYKPVTLHSGVETLSSLQKYLPNLSSFPVFLV